jgi:hypothetical protein
MFKRIFEMKKRLKYKLLKLQVKFMDFLQQITQK